MVIQGETCLVQILDKNSLISDINYIKIRLLPILSGSSLPTYSTSHPPPLSLSSPQQPKNLLNLSSPSRKPQISPNSKAESIISIWELCSIYLMNRLNMRLRWGWLHFWIWVGKREWWCLGDIKGWKLLVLLMIILEGMSYYKFSRFPHFVYVCMWWVHMDWYDRDRYGHSPESWKTLWKQIFTQLKSAEFANTNVIVDAVLKYSFDIRAIPAREKTYMLVWSVRIVWYVVVVVIRGVAIGL